ncbi:MAG: GtrA family protein [Candidatus Colwellbacteria bacterium]|nr:GtrA family protein [Candidatus Colwellbacteria bacterium]
MKNKDVRAGLLAAVLIGLLSYPTLRNIDFVIQNGAWMIVAVSVILALLTIVGLVSVKFLSRWWQTFWQLGKFIVTGGLNTFLDFAVLNILMTLTAITSGWWFSLFKAISFSVAVINSYFWNKHWTFEVGRKKSTEFIEFLMVSLVGLGINVGTASFVVRYVAPSGGLSAVTWANVGALAAIILGLVWNFLGYKFLVFRRQN